MAVEREEGIPEANDQKISTFRIRGIITNKICKKILNKVLAKRKIFLNFSKLN